MQGTWQRWEGKGNYRAMTGKKGKDSFWVGHTSKGEKLLSTDGRPKCIWTKRKRGIPSRSYKGSWGNLEKRGPFKDNIGAGKAALYLFPFGGK